MAVWEGHAASAHHAANVSLAAAELAGAACLEWLGDEAVLSEKVTGEMTCLYINRTLFEQTTPAIKLLVGDALAHLGDPRLSSFDHREPAAASRSYGLLRTTDILSP